MFSRLACRCGAALQALPKRPAWSVLLTTRSMLLAPLQQQQRSYIRGALRPPTTRSSGAPRLKTKSRLGRPSEQRWEMLRNMVAGARHEKDGLAARTRMACHRHRHVPTSGMLGVQVTSLIHHERIRTTVSKAKELRRLADRVVTLAKRGTPEARQKAGNIVRTEWDLAKLLTSARVADAISCRASHSAPCSHSPPNHACTTRPSPCSRAVLAHRFKDRQGGYSRVLLTYPRVGDSAPMAYVEYLDRPVEEMRMPWRLQASAASRTDARAPITSGPSVCRTHLHLFCCAVCSRVAGATKVCLPGAQWQGVARQQVQSA